MARTDFVDDPTGQNPLSKVAAADMNQIGVEINTNTADVANNTAAIAVNDGRLDALESAPPGGGGGYLLPTRCADVGGETYTIVAGDVTQIAGTLLGGVTPNVGDRVVVAGAPASSGVGTWGSTQPGNGVYEVTAVTTDLALSRTTDMSGSVNPSGLAVRVTEGDWAGDGIGVIAPTDPEAAFVWGTDTLQWDVIQVRDPLAVGSTIDADVTTVTNLEVASLKGSAVITAAEVAAINFDNVLPTGAAVKTLVDAGGGGGELPIDKYEVARNRLDAVCALQDVAEVPWVGWGSSSMQGLNATQPGRRFFNMFMSLTHGKYPAYNGIAAATETLSAVAGQTLPFGIVGVNAGVSGATAVNYINSTTRGQAVALGVRVCVHMIGGNEWAAGTTTPTQFETNLTNQVQLLDNASPHELIHIIITQPPRPDIMSPVHPWADFGAAMEAVADLDPGHRIWIDFTEIYADIYIPGSDAFGFIDNDGVHQKDRGHKFMARKLYSELYREAPFSSAIAADTEPPTKPNIAFVSKTSTSITVNLSGSTDNVAVTGYRAYNDGVQFNETPDPDGTITITGLTPSTEYDNITGTAVDAEGNESVHSDPLAPETTNPPGVDLWSMPGLVAIYDPELDATVTALGNGAQVSSLTPASGTELSPLTQGTSGNQPTVETGAYNGKRAIVHDGSNDVMSTGTWSTTYGPDGASPTPMVFFWFGEFVDGQILCTTSTTVFLVARKASSSSDDMSLFAGSTSSFATVPNVGDTPRVLAIKYKDGTDECKVWNNSLTHTTYTMPSNSNSRMADYRIGLNPAGAFGLDGKWGLSALVAADVSDSDIQDAITQVAAHFAHTLD